MLVCIGNGWGTAMACIEVSTEGQIPVGSTIVW